MNIFGVIMKADWGINTKNWIVDQASALALAAIVIVIIPLILKKQWAGLLGTLTAGAVAIYFTTKPDTLVGIGQIIYGIISGS